MKCSFCKTEVQPGMNYCPNCATRLPDTGSAPKKRYWMYYLIAGILVAVGIAAVSILGNQSKGNTPVTTSTSSRSSSSYSYSYNKTPEEKVPASKKGINKVIYDKNDIKITFQGFDNDGYMPKFLFQIVNNSDRNISLMSDNESVNDCMVTTILATSVAAGKRATDDMVMYPSDLKDNGITEVKKFEFSLRVSDSDEYEKLDELTIVIDM